jgi:DNA-binding transcriptional ArsR family regulator
MSPISTSSGCSMAKATARATAPGSMPSVCIRLCACCRTSGSSRWSTSSVLTKPGEIEVVRRTPSVDSWRSADARGLTAADLVRRLRVSPASVSKSIARLEAIELVARQLDPGGRRERYLIDDDVWLQAWRADTDAHGEIATAAQQGIQIFGTETTAGARLGRMGRFFALLREQMSGSTLTDSTGYDALTVLAALAHAGRPLTLDALATGLGWSWNRATDALDTIERQPAIADPLALQFISPETYGLTARPDRLSPAQRRAFEN